MPDVRRPPGLAVTVRRERALRLIISCVWKRMIANGAVPLVEHGAIVAIADGLYRQLAGNCHETVVNALDKADDF